MGFQKKASEAASRMSELSAAEDRGEILNDGIFYLFSLKKNEASVPRFALPKVEELGLNIEVPNHGAANVMEERQSSEFTNKGRNLKQKGETRRRVDLEELDLNRISNQEVPMDERGYLKSSDNENSQCKKD